ncbi:MAG: selenocysteine-specific translation elongation factor [Bacillota bacterium]
MSYYTIGIAGHIDHGKTTLTKALTNVDTDRLKEEKERNISIELGYAPFQIKEGYHVSIIDVPGHEKFIRQMIAGVTGIDLAVIVVAADEGLMPQTKEHIEILSLLGIEQVIFAITKADLVDEEQLELAEEEIRDYIDGTIFETADIIYVDGISKRGISEFKEKAIEKLYQCQRRDDVGALRLPIDQVFSLQGHGTILRGTVFNGSISTGQSITVLPQGYKAKVRQLQSQNENVCQAFAGQRVAVNISGIDRQHVNRGNVIVNSNHYALTDCIDVIIRTTKLMELPLKQRSLVKLHIGTSEVMGKIIFFDRNTLEVEAGEEVYCQIRLDEPIVGKKGDRFILRRPTPVETFAGGRIINVNGKKYRFGKTTIDILKQLEQGSDLDRLIFLLQEYKLLSSEDIIKQLGLTEQELHLLLEEGKSSDQIIQISRQYTTQTIVKQIENNIIQQLKQYHDQYPLRSGISKAELLQIYNENYSDKLVSAVIQKLNTDNLICLRGPNISLDNFQTRLPKQWEKKMTAVIRQLEEQGLEPQPIGELMNQTGMSTKLATEYLNYLKNEGIVEKLDEKHFIHHKVVSVSCNLLKNAYPNSFTLQEAKTILNTSRKYLVWFLELLDQKKWTVRDNNKRLWVN